MKLAFKLTRARELPAQSPQRRGRIRTVLLLSMVSWLFAVSAGLLIDQAGLKGTRVGNAMIAPEHANFIVNLGGATAADVHALLEVIREKVGVPMELEYELWPERPELSQAQTAELR